MRLGGLLLVTALLLGSCRYERSAEPVEPPTTSTSSDPTAQRSLPLVADGVRNRGGLATVTGATLVISEYPASALLAFDVGGVHHGCITSASLSVAHLAGEAAPAAWVSLEGDLASLRDGDDLGQQVIAPGSPSVLPERADGRFRWDVTELVRWQQQRRADPAAFVVVLKPTREGSAELGATEGGAGAQLVVTERTGCSSATG